MATHSSILAWKIPWTEESGGLQPTCRKESDTTERLSLHAGNLFLRIHAGASSLYTLGDCGGLFTKSYPTFVTPWTAACQAPLSMGFSRQEY